MESPPNIKPPQSRMRSISGGGRRGRPRRNGHGGDSKNITLIHRFGCLCPSCGKSMVGPSDNYDEHIIMDPPLCTTCYENDMKGLHQLINCAKQKARLELGLSHNDHSIVVSGIIIVEIRKLKARVKRSKHEEDIEPLVKELQFINFSDLQNLMPNVLEEIILLYDEFICKFSEVERILQHLMCTILYAIHRQAINLKKLCIILIKAASKEHKDDSVTILISILNLLASMIAQNKEDIMPEIEKAPDTNPAVKHIKEEILKQ